MKNGDKVKHKIKGWFGVSYSFEKYGILVNWSDNTGVRFRLARRGDLEVLDEKPTV